jgi:hypothetical protein
MFRRGKMRVSECTCLMCGSGLELKIEKVRVGDNRGECPMCSEPYCINITGEEMAEFQDAEEM